MIDLKDYIAFRELLAIHESSGRYGVVNQFGFLGRYQFGKMRLTDLGLIDITGWRWGLYDEKFLRDSKLQDATFAVHVAQHLRTIDRRYASKMGAEIAGIPLTASGLVAAAHLVGMGAVAQMIRTGNIPQDANGTTAIQYMKWMGGKDLPRNLPLDLTPFMLEWLKK
jgi:hypothetical protein